MTDTEGDSYANTVFLRGVFAAEATSQILPSGDELCSFRVTVRRPPDAARAGRIGVDSIDCSATRASVTKVAARTTPGEIVELTGRLQRRFWRGPGGVASRYEVEVSSFKREPAAARRRAGRQSGG
jgi:single-strand DNA-binding protein